LEVEFADEEFCVVAFFDVVEFAGFLGYGDSAFGGGLGVKLRQRLDDFSFVGGHCFPSRAVGHKDLLKSLSSIMLIGFAKNSHHGKLLGVMCSGFFGVLSNILDSGNFPAANGRNVKIVRRNIWFAFVE